LDDLYSYLKLSSHRPQGNKSYKKIHVSHVSVGEKKDNPGESGIGWKKTIMHCGGDQS